MRNRTKQSVRRKSRTAGEREVANTLMRERRKRRLERESSAERAERMAAEAESSQLFYSSMSDEAKKRRLREKAVMTHEHYESLPPERKKKRVDERKGQRHARQDHLSHGPRIPSPERFCTKKWPPLLYLGPPKKCECCGALFFSQNCCADGKVHLPWWPRLPEEQEELLLDQSKTGKDYRVNSVIYNTGFSMASLEYDHDLKLKAVFNLMKVQGALNYQLGGFRPPDDEKIPLFLQLYTMEPDLAAELRLQNPHTGPKMDPVVVHKLSEMMQRVNYLAKQVYTVSEIIEDAKSKGQLLKKDKLFSLVTPTAEQLKKAGVHLSTIRRPATEMLTLLFKEDEGGAMQAPSVCVVMREGYNRVRRIKWHNPMVDALCFPLIEPYGLATYELGKYKLFPKKTKFPYGETDEEFTEEPSKEERRKAIPKKKEKERRKETTPVYDEMGLEEEYESDDSFDLNDLDDHPRSEGQPEPIDQLDTSDLENDGQGNTVFLFSV